MCAIKYSHLEGSSATCEAEVAEHEDGERDLLIEAAEEEEKRWNAICDDSFRARAQCLGGKHSLVMPYGHPLAAEVDDRWQHVPAIRKQLELFAQCRKGAKGRPGYKYKDLRWRDVLLDAEKNVFLCNLESLEVVGDTEEQDELVYEQLANLLWSMRNERGRSGTLCLVEFFETCRCGILHLWHIGTLKDFFDGG